MMEPFNYSAIVLGLQEQGKSHRARHRVLMAVNGQHPSGYRPRAFVLDPAGAFRSIAVTYESAREWAERTRAAAASKKPTPLVARFPQEDPERLLGAAVAAAASGRRPSLLVFDEGLLVRAACSSYIAPWLQAANANRRHLADDAGVGFILCAQSADVHRQLLSSATEVDLFRVVDEQQLERVRVACAVPRAIMATVPLLRARQFRSGRPGFPESWR